MLRHAVTCKLQNVCCTGREVPECATKALRGCVRLPSKEAGKNLTMSCQSLALNSPALHACSKRAGMLAGTELRPCPMVSVMATSAVTQVRSPSQAFFACALIHTLQEPSSSQDHTVAGGW